MRWIHAPHVCKPGRKAAGLEDLAGVTGSQRWAWSVKERRKEGREEGKKGGRKGRKKERRASSVGHTSA